MANTLTEVIPKLLAQGLMALREMAVMPRLVNRDYDSMAADYGATIDVPIPSAIAVQNVAPDKVPPTTANIAPTSVPIPLDRWKEAPFYLTDKDELEAISGTIPMQASEAVKAIGNEVDQYLLGLGAKFYGYHGTAGTTPFGTPGIADATGIRKVLNKQLAPGNPRHVVMDPDAEAAALGLEQFGNAQFSGNIQAILEGELNRKLGFQWWMDQNVGTHTAGTLTGSIVTGAAAALGAKTVQLDTDGGEAIALKEGDIVVFSNHAQTYVVTADLTVGASSNGNVTFEPGLQTALSGGETISVKGSHALNIAFHRDAIAFATRPLTQDTEQLGAITQSAVDPVSGIALRLEVTREHKRKRFSYDILYGAAVVRRELGARLAG